MSNEHQRQIRDIAKRLRDVVQVLRDNDPSNFTEDDMDSLAQMLENMAGVMEGLSQEDE